MFLNISSRNVKHLHLYGSVFIDEFSIKRITDRNRFNFIGYKLGGSLSNWPLKDLALDLESTIIYPMVYKHRVASLTFASNKYNLGYFMGANSMDFHIRLRYRPLYFLFAEVHYEYAVHGIDYEYILNVNLDRHPLISKKAWDRQNVSFRITYLPVVGIKLFLEAQYSIMKGYEAGGTTADENLNQFSPEVYWGKNLFLNIGFHLGL
jgi:hypothetical protein